MLSPKASAEAGPWRTDRTPYLREIMDCLSPHHPAQRVVFMKGSQVGATECGNNWLGYIVDCAPGPALMVYPTVDDARKISKQRIAPMIEATPRLRDRVAEPRARDSGNTTFAKEFPGGLLMLTGANSASGLRATPVRYLFLDEVDQYPGDVEGQGDPVLLAEKRTITFARRKILIVSSPTIRDLSRIEDQYLLTDQRRYFVRCPACNHPDWIQWTIGGWRGKEGRHHSIYFDAVSKNPQSARLLCARCDAKIEERHKPEMLAGGQWRPTAVGSARTAGFHLSGLYSPLGWKSWAECVDEFLHAKADPFKLKQWVNTILGESWEERADTIELGSLEARAHEQYDGEVPTGVGVLVAAVDVQGDRLECAVKGYGTGEESWLIAFSQFHGDPGDAKVWAELDRFLLQKFKHASGREIIIECVTVDSGGLHTDQVYRFCKVRIERRVFAVKGGSERGREIVSRPTTNNRYRVKLFVLCVDTGKDVVYSRLRIGAPGPGFMHLPEGVADPEYLAQLTSERAIRKYVRGRGSVREWVLPAGKRNEALDLEVYCLAALYILGPAFLRSLPERAASFSRRLEAKTAAGPAVAESEAPARARRPRRPGGFVMNW